MTSPPHQSSAGPAHIPVMVDQVVAALAPRDGGLYVDGTFGAGGYSRAILDSADCTVVGIDRDPDAIAEGAEVAARYDGRLILVHGRFSQMDTLLGGHGIDLVDGVAIDCGVSTMQLDRPERGFSFRHDAVLDMRMEKSGATAADIVNTETEERLAQIIREFGEERRARRVARAICKAREQQRITGTAQLADIVRAAVGPKGASDIDPATRTFMAFRIFVNNELGEITGGLCAAEAVLKEGGRLAVVTFHSLEDRIVKTFLRQRAGQAPRGSRHLPDDAPAARPSFSLVTRRAARPSADEIARNPRSRSAHLRTAERTAAPPFKREAAA